MKNSNNNFSSGKMDPARSRSRGKMDPALSRSDGSQFHVVYIVFISLVLDLLAFTLILPLLPSLLDYYASQPDDSLYQRILGYIHHFRELVGAPDIPRWNSVLFGGIIGSLFSFLQFLVSPIIGAASDHYGRRPLMLITMVGVAASYGLWALSGSFTVFVIARVVGGISKGNISLSTTIVTDVTTPETRGRGMAMIGIAFSIGFVFGPLIGAGFSVWARSQQGSFFIFPALFALTLAIADILFVFMFLKETLPENKRTKSIASSWRSTFHLINPASLFKFSSVKNVSPEELVEMRTIGMAYFLYLFLYSGLEFTLTFLTHNRFNYDSMQQGKMFFVLGTVMALLQGGYVRRVKMGKEKKVALQGMTILIPAFVTMAYASTPLMLYVGLLLFAFASSTVVPCLTTLISGYGGESEKGAVLGIFRSLGALARGLGPMVASTAYWSIGDRWCYVLGSILLLIPLFTLARLKLHLKK